MASIAATDLFQGIKNGDAVTVRKAVETGSTINEYSAVTGLTPLGASILHGKVDIAKILLDAGADIRLGYKSALCQETLRLNWPEVSPPIHCASASGSADLIRILVEYGADVNDPSGLDYGAEMLPLYVATGQATQTLIDLGADVSRMNAVRFTPIVHAIAREDVQSVKQLVEHGADVEIERTAKYRVRIGAEDSDADEQLIPGTSSPLIVAGHQGRLRPTSAQMIQILASGGADVNRRHYIKDASDINFTLLSLICGSRVPVPKLKGQYANNLRYAEKEVATIRALVNAGVDVNDPPVLHYLCEGDMPFQDFGPRFEVLNMLLEHGASVDSAAIQAALLKTFTKTAEAEIQFRDMATALAKAGAHWHVLHFDETTVPEYFR